MTGTPNFARGYVRRRSRNPRTAGRAYPQDQALQTSFLQSQHPRSVVGVAVAFADVAAEDLEGAVAGLPLDRPLGGTAGGGLGGEAGPERMAGELGGVELGAASGPLDHPGDQLRRDAFFGRLPERVLTLGPRPPVRPHPPEQRAAGDVTDVKPAAERDDRAGLPIGGLEGWRRRDPRPPGRSCSAGRG